MTIQEAIKKLTSSEDLKKKAIEALNNGKGNEFLKEQGIDYSLDQIKEFLQPKESGELSREQLDMAAGGGFCGDDVFVPDPIRTADPKGDPLCGGGHIPPEVK